ncbi:MAG: hypothetical protein WD651_08590 [Acidimicrobiia bacterium]
MKIASQILGLLLVGGVVALVVQGLGAAMLPEGISTQPTLLSQPDSSQLRTLLPLLEELEGTVAVVAVGGTDGSFVMDRVIASDLSEDGRFSVSFRNGSSDSLVIAGTRSPGAIDGEALDVSGSFSGQSLFGTRGQCTATIESMEMRETKPFDISNYSVGPIGSGTVSCVGMKRIGSDQLVSLEAVFRFDQRLCYGGPNVCP